MLSENKQYFLHPTALLDAEHVGERTRIWAFTHVCRDVVIGDDCNIGSHCYLESGVRIGNRVTIKNGNNIWLGVSICDDAFIGPQVVFTNDLRPRSPRLADAACRYESVSWLSPTMVEEGASIGGGAVIRAGISLGRFCMVAAGAVVTRTVPAHALVLGMPARVVGWVCRCGEALTFEKMGRSRAYCRHCYAVFEVSADCIHAAPADEGAVSLVDHKL
jgi:UDP-2-acetamido-3-amino-2,3-dideoxy-glucuronate N-acetyltransferase